MAFALAFLVRGGGVEAATSVPLAVGATIPVAVELTINPLGGPFTTELSSVDTRDVSIADLEISSNSPNGFQVTFQSINAGRLVREGSTGASEGDYTTYVLDLEDTPGGVLGSALPPAQERLGLDLSRGTETVRFDDNVTGPTVQKLLSLEIQTRAKAGLFAGTYTDTVTVTVEDL